MNQGKLVFAQLTEHLPLTTFRRCVERYQGEYKVRRLSCLDQFLCMAFAQLTFRESLREIEACLNAQNTKLYHMGIRAKRVARSTLADANETRDWRIYADFAQSLIGIARRLYADQSFGVDLNETVYALDTTTIDLCLSVFPWAPFMATKAAVKLHTLLDLRGNIPTFIHITDGKVHDVNVLDQLIPEPGAFYVLDRGFLDYARLYRFHQAGSFFVTRARSNMEYRRRYSHAPEQGSGVISDQTIAFTGFYAQQDFPSALRRVRFTDAATGKTLVFLTNNFLLPASVIAQLYRCRWQVELFFKWIKQHLRIKRFFGTSENAVKSQIWIAVSVYVLVAIVKKRLNLKPSLFQLLQVLSLTTFERTPLDQLLAFSATDQDLANASNQLTFNGF